MSHLKITTRVSYKAYWQAIAAAHKEVDGFKYGDKDVIRNDNRSDMPARVLWAAPYEKVKYGDKASDNTMKRKTARVAYLLTADSALFADEDAAFDKCELVIEQILAKILQDKRGAEVMMGEPPEPVWSILATDVNSFSGGPVELKIGSTKYIGWELQIDYLDNTNLAYDASKWN